MKIFSRTRGNDRLNGPLPIDFETGLYNRNFFLIRLKEERERTKRTGSPFSLIVLDVAGMSAALSEKAKRLARIHPMKLAASLLGTARKTDIKGWLDASRVGILMPDTEQSGAIGVKEKICQQMKKHRPYGESLNLAQFLDVYTFHEGSLNGIGSSLDGHDPTSMGCSLEDNPIYSDILDTSLSYAPEQLVKRFFDIVGSLLGIILTFPLMLIIAILIKLTCPGPILFRQKRVGFLGRQFVFLKFRSMVADADHGIHERYVTDLINGQTGRINRGEDEQPLYKMNEDPRITPVGGLLRKTSLDELPQLFNILRGDMSLVGPRPPIPYEVDRYRLWHCGRFLEVKPGLTGIWQVSGRSQTTFDEMVRLDLRYAENWSLWLDIKIILKTLPAVLSAKGAY